MEAEEQPDEHKPPPVSSPPRTRKARDTQYRLGVGRPTIAGGSGARAVTKSVSLSRGSKGAKSTRNTKPSEETIIEGEPRPLLGRPSVVSPFSEPEQEPEPGLEPIPVAVKCQSTNEFRS
jgi:hypothetical protein